MPATTTPSVGTGVRELRERRLQIVEVAVGVEVLEVDVRDDRDVGRQRMERAIVFVRLGDEHRAAAVPQVRSAAAERASTITAGSSPACGGSRPIIAVVVVFP